MTRRGSCPLRTLAIACRVAATSSDARSVIGISSSRIAGDSSGRTWVIRRSSRRFNTMTRGRGMRPADQITLERPLEIEVVRYASALIAERIDQQLNAVLRLCQRVHSQVDIEQIDIPGQLAVAEHIYLCDL